MLPILNPPPSPCWAFCKYTGITGSVGFSSVILRFIRTASFGLPSSQVLQHLKSLGVSSVSRAIKVSC